MTQRALTRIGFLLAFLVPAVLGFELRVRSFALPGTGDVGQVLALREARANAVRDAAAQGLKGPEALARISTVFEATRAGAAADAAGRNLTRRLDDALRDPGGTPYLLGTDPFRWLRRARNIVERGGVGESRRHGREWNELTGIAGGTPDANLQVVATGWVARLWKGLGGPDITTIAWWSPVAVSILMILAAVLLGMELGGVAGGLASGMFLAVMPAVFLRTTAGYADTDTWNLLLALLITWLLAGAAGAPERRGRLVRVAGAVILMGVFAWNWPGWWFQYLVTVSGLSAGAAALAGWSVLVKRRESGSGRAAAVLSAPEPGATSSNASRAGAAASDLPGRLALALLFFAAGGALFALLIAGPDRLASLWREPMAALGMLQRTVGEAWPNVYVTVGELQPIPVREMVTQLGGHGLAGLGMIGLLLLPFLRRDPATWTGTFILLAWTAAAALATTRGARFMVMLGPPLAVGAGSLLGAVFTRLMSAGTARRAGFVSVARGQGAGSRRPGFPRVAGGQGAGSGWIVFLRVVGAVLTGLVFLYLTVELRRGAGKATRSLDLLPLMNDTWAECFSWIRRNAAPDAVICAWWDFGDLITAETGRRVLFDAGTQVSPTSYWLGRTLAADDPAKAEGILRMLCLGREAEAYEALRRDGHPPHRSVSLLGEAARLGEASRASMLRATGVSDSAARIVLEALAGDPPEGYLWLTEDLTWKTHAWGRFGRWDFRKAAFYERTAGLPREDVSRVAADLGIGREEAEGLLGETSLLKGIRAAGEWIAPTPVVSPLTACAAGPGGILTDGGTFIHGLPLLPAAILRSGSTTLAFCRRKEIPWAISIPRDLSSSLYMRLMYGTPEGPGPFERVFDAETEAGERVALYRIRWE